MVRNEAFIVLEKSLSDRLMKGWSRISEPFLRTIWNLVEKGDYRRAKEMALTVNLDPVLRDTLPYIQYITEASLLFGATRITEKAENTEIADDHRVADDVSEAAVRQLITAVQQKTEHAIRETLLQLIAQASTELKYDPEQLRAPAGSETGGQWVKDPTAAQPSSSEPLSSSQPSGSAPTKDSHVPRKITESVVDMVRRIGPVKDRHGAAKLVRELAKQNKQGFIDVIDKAPHNKRESVLIHKGDEALGIPTVWALGWGNSLGTDLHGHGKSEVGVTVLRGRVVEHAYVPEKPGGNLFEDSQKPGGTKVRIVTRELGEDGVMELPSPYLHDVFGTSGNDDKRDVTLHAYFPPLKRMEYFQMDRNKNLTWDGVWDENRPDISDTKERKSEEDSVVMCCLTRGYNREREREEFSRWADEVIKKYDPDQPRIPAGEPNAGQWVPWNGPVALGHSLGISRADMPQIKWKHYDKLREFAEGRNVPVTFGRTLAETLKPAQNEYNPNKMRFAQSDKLKKPVIISSDNYVLDGTHRWLYYRMKQPDKKLPIMRIGLPARQALSLMHHFPYAGIKDVHGNVIKYDEDQPRDENGRWTDDNALKFDPDQPRIPAGEEGGGQWAKEGGTVSFNQKDKNWYKDGKPMGATDQTRLRSLKVPPAWIDVRLNPNAMGDLQAVGKDVKGRTQYLYSAAHTEKAAAEKFNRLKDFNPRIPEIQRVSAHDMQFGRTKEEKDTAAVLHLIAKTGFRIGSDADTKTKHKAFGASTLKGHHVKVDGDKLSFSFVAKKGVRINKTIHDPLLAQHIRANAAKGLKLFATNETLVRDYLHRITGNNDFKVKDLRTWHGTAKAIEKASKLREPKTEKEFKKWKREIAKTVANHLGNTPAVALASYIDPSIFKPYHEKWGVKKADSFEKLMSIMNDYFETTHYADDRVILPWQMVVETGIDPDDNPSDEIYIREEVRKFHEDQPRDTVGRWTKLLGGLFPEARRKRWDEKLHTRLEDWMVGVLENYGDEHDLKYFKGGAVEAYDKKGKPLAFWDGYSGYAMTRKMEFVQKLTKIKDFTSFAEGANSEAAAQMQLLSGLHTSRVSAYGFLIEAKALGYTQYQISSQLDNRGCPVCEFMDGKVFEIDDLEEALDEIFSANSPDDLAHIQEWPGQSKEDLNALYGMSDQEIIALNWNLPPWHPNCRCLCVPVGTPTLPENTPSYEEAAAQQEPDELPKSLEEISDKQINSMANQLDGLDGPHALAVWEDLADEYGDDVLEELTGLTEAAILLGAKLNKKKFPGL